MEVQELQAIEHVALGQAIDDFDHLGGGEPEFRAITRGIRPTPDTLGRQFRAHTEQRPDADLLRSPEHDVDLFQTFEYDDHGLVEALRQERGLDVAGVLVAVADDQAADLLHRGECDQKLRFRACFESEIPWPATRDHFLHEVALLVDLDREHPAIDARVLVLGDGFLERLVDQLDAMTNDVRKANQQWQLEAARFQVLGQLEQVDGLALIGAGRDLDVSARTDMEVGRAPTLNLVALRAALGRPFTRTVVDLHARASGGVRIGRRGRKADVLCHWCFVVAEYSRECPLGGPNIRCLPCGILGVSPKRSDTGNRARVRARTRLASRFCREQRTSRGALLDFDRPLFLSLSLAASQQPACTSARRHAVSLLVFSGTGTGTFIGGEP